MSDFELDFQREPFPLISVPGFMAASLQKATVTANRVAMAIESSRVHNQKTAIVWTAIGVQDLMTSFVS